jgi:hypothetical protein
MSESKQHDYQGLSSQIAGFQDERAVQLQRLLPL